MLGLPFSIKPMQSSVFPQLAKLWLFLFFQQIPKPLAAAHWLCSDLLSLCCACCRSSFPPVWVKHYYWPPGNLGILFCQVPHLDNCLHKRGWLKVRSGWFYQEQKAYIQLSCFLFISNMDLNFSFFWKWTFCHDTVAVLIILIIQVNVCVYLQENI